MSRLLEEDPYVPLSMRENTAVAIREALGLVIPLILLAFVDNQLSFGSPQRLVGIVAGFIGAYVLVTVTSSHEQAILRPLFPQGMDMTSRYLLGSLGSILLVIAIYLSLAASFRAAPQEAAWEERACAEFMLFVIDFYQENGYDITVEDFDYYPGNPCEKMRAWYDEQIGGRS